MVTRAGKNRRASRRRMVCIAVAEDRRLAEQYRRLLGKHAIPAEVRMQRDADAFGVALYVRERNLETAYRLIEAINGPGDGPAEEDWLTERQGTDWGTGDTDAEDDD